jgi:hypothetical protein
MSRTSDRTIRRDCDKPRGAAGAELRAAKRPQQSGLAVRPDAAGSTAEGLPGMRPREAGELRL